MRQPRQLIPKIRQSHIFFWHKCTKCDTNIRKEDMWIAWRTGYGSDLYKDFFCKECFPIKTDFMKYVYDHKINFHQEWINESQEWLEIIYGVEAKIKAINDKFDKAIEEAYKRCEQSYEKE